MKRGMVAVALGALIAFWAAPAFAQVVCRDSSASPPCFVEESTKTKGATTITWDSSYQDPGYTLGDTIIMTVTWSVDAGAAEYVSFGLKQNPNKAKNGGDPLKNAFTPRGGDPAAGSVPTVQLICDSDDTCILNEGTPDEVTIPEKEGVVEAQFNFTGLHLDMRRECEIGNAHFKLFLRIDKDGDGVPETEAGYGVNAHVEDPQATDTSVTACPIE